MTNKTINIDQEMIIKLIPFIILICAAIFLKKYQANSRTPSINTTIMQAEDEELDLIMTTWFDSFMMHQANGETMYQADRLASSAASLAISKKENLMAKGISKSTTQQQ